MGVFYWLTESGANGSIVITPQVSCMLFDFPEMNLCFAQYGYKRIEFKGKVSVFCFAKNKIIFLLLTISDPQKRSLLNFEISRIFYSYYKSAFFRQI